MDLKQLNEKYAINGHINFEAGKGGLTIAKIQNSNGSAVISLYGAHVQSFQPKGGKEVFWMSSQSDFEVGKPIRGGIPVCFPWFGPHATNSQLPQHGIARLRNWEVTKTTALANGNTELILSLTSNDETLAMWSYSFTAEMKIIAGKTFEASLSFTNTGNEAFTCSAALHSYYNVSDSAKIGIAGLSGHNYYAGFAKEANNVQSDALLKIAQEENRRYIKHTSDCTIEDSGFSRKLKIGKKGSNITVVWNPWEINSKNIGDIPDDGFKYFVCVEAVNYYDDVVTLKPGEKHILSALVSVE
jgi:glucose-6-phosphate 1-epimerase